MRERLDCAMLGFTGMADGCMQKEGAYARGRLYLHYLELPEPVESNIDTLARMASHLQRFDVCLVLVCEENLAWVRQAMLVARTQLRTPVVGLVRNLKAPAIGDLYNLGMVDFVCEPLCTEEIRIRTERLLDRCRPSSGSYYMGGAGQHRCAVNDGSKDYRSKDAHSDTAASAVAVSHDANPGAVLDSGTERHPGEVALEAFAVALASQCAVSGVSLKTAKARVVHCFEPAFIRAMLIKSSGNIALAARWAKKHRRAFWALMRKYGIDAASYRKAMPPNNS